MKMHAIWRGIGSAFLAYGLAQGAMANPVTLSLFYTTFAGGTNVHEANVTLSGSTLTINTNTNVAATAGADGLLFLPDNNLAIAGQGPPGAIHEITTAGAAVANANSPAGHGSFHLALNGTGTILYSMCNGECNGSLTQLALSGSGGLVNGSTGTAISVSGGTSQDIRGIIFDPVNNTWYYGTAGDGANGTFGTITFSGSTATLTQLLSNVPAHGLTFDPFTNDIFFSSASTIDQFDPLSGTIVSSVTTAGGNFDQSAADGHGHLFVAGNSGTLVGIDYDAATGHLIGGPGATLGSVFLAGALDDIAPLSGIGGGGGGSAPEPATIALLGLGLAGLGFSRRK